MSKYNAHTDPLFKNLNLLNVFDLFKLNSLKFAYKYHKETLPDYFSGMFDSVEIHHDYNTRHHIQHDPQPKRSTTEKCMRYFVPTLLHDTQDCITEKLFTHGSGYPRLAADRGGHFTNKCGIFGQWRHLLKLKQTSVPNELSLTKHEITHLKQVINALEFVSKCPYFKKARFLEIS